MRASCGFPLSVCDILVLLLIRSDGSMTLHDKNPVTCHFRHLFICVIFPESLISFNVSNWLKAILFVFSVLFV